MLVAGITLAVGAASSVHAEPGDTINAPGPSSPREVTVPGRSNDISLLDGDGRSIPLTGEGIIRDGDTTRIRPPKLAEGTYTLVYDNGSETFTVGDIAAMSSPDTQDDGFPLTVLLLAAPLAPAL